MTIILTSLFIGFHSSFSAALGVPEAVRREIRGAEGVDHHPRVRRPGKPQAQDHLAQRGESIGCSAKLPQSEPICSQC